MNIKDHLNIDELHHAYAFVGNRETVLKSLISFVEQDLSISTQNNPDFWMKGTDVLGIDDARELSELHLRKSFSGGKKIFVLQTDSITVEAQNALLKLFEEPIPGNHFFLLISEDKGILPTLRSRMMVTLFHESGEDDGKIGREFLSASLSERLGVVGKIAEAKDKVEAKKLVRSLIDALHSHDEKTLMHSQNVLADLIKAEDYLSDRAPSIKMLLEHIAHTLPV